LKSRDLKIVSKSNNKLTVLLHFLVIMVDMTKEAIAQMCKDLKLYRTPELNDKLYLHYKGYRKIQNLEEYTGCRALWLEGNGLNELSGLDTLVELRSLYIQENCIDKIQNLDNNVNLATLNMNKNCVEKIENLNKHPKLETLMLSHNRLATKEDLEKVTECQSITTLDIQHNNIEDPAILDVLVKMKNLRALYLQGNPVTRKIKYYRKKLTFLLPELRYLDDRPVFPDDRLRAVAFMTALTSTEVPDVKAAQAAEREEIARQRAEKKAKEEANFQAFEDLIRNARLKAEQVKQAGEEKVEDEKVEDGDEEDDEDSPWATTTSSSSSSSSAAAATTTTTGDGKQKTTKDYWEAHGKNTGKKVVDEGHANGINPFFNEPIVEVDEHPNLKKAREARLAGIMSRGDAPPPAPQAPSSSAVAPPVPPTYVNNYKQNNADDPNEDDVFGWEPPSALVQLQSMVGEVDREEAEKSTGTKRKGGIVIAADVERSNMAALKKQSDSINAASALTKAPSSSVAPPAPPAAQVEQTDVDELD
jgi:dynein assembly factor 1